MSEKRRDKKKRILRNGESQRKDGRYAYKYYDNAGNVQFVYSWKLEKGDRLPAGKRDDLALREKEREIKQRLEAELIPQGGRDNGFRTCPKVHLVKNRCTAEHKDRL